MKHMYVNSKDCKDQKLKIIKEIREENPGGAYKKIAREQFGFVI